MEMWRKKAPRETEDHSYAKFWGDKQRALWYVMVFLESSIEMFLMMTLGIQMFGVMRLDIEMFGVMTFGIQMFGVMTFGI